MKECSDKVIYLYAYRYSLLNDVSVGDYKEVANFILNRLHSFDDFDLRAIRDVTLHYEMANPAFSEKYSDFLTDFVNTVNQTLRFRAEGKTCAKCRWFIKRPGGIGDNWCSNLGNYTSDNYCLCDEWQGDLGGETDE